MLKQYGRLALLITFALLALLIVIRVRAVLLPFFLALVLTYCLAPFVDRLQERGLARNWAILLLYAFLALWVSALVIWIIPDLLRELTRLAAALPGYSRRLQDWLFMMQGSYTRLDLPDPVRQAVDRGLSTLELRGERILAGSIAGILGLFNAVFSLVLAPVLAYYLLRDLERFKRLFVRLLPEQRNGRWLMLLVRLDRVLAGFIRGQFFMAIFVGVTTCLFMTLLGMRYTIMLGFLAGITEVIPYFGPLIGALPAVALAALISPLMVLKVIAAYLLIHELDSSVVGPKVIGETVGLHPLAVVFALLAGGHLFGLAGVVLAVPVTACLKVLFSFGYDLLTVNRARSL